MEVRREFLAKISLEEKACNTDTKMERKSYALRLERVDFPNGIFYNLWHQLNALARASRESLALVLHTVRPLGAKISVTSNDFFVLGGRKRNAK